MRRISKILMGMGMMVLMSSCVPQMVLNFALKRDEAKDRQRYEGAMNAYKGRYGQWMAAVKDTTMVSPNDGAKLHAIYRKADQPTKKTAVILHGYTGNAASMLNMALFYNRELGYNVLLPDFYAHGLSEGRMRQMGWLDRHDMLAWMKLANSLFAPQGEETEMIVTGVSMGGATTMMVSGEVESEGMTYVKAFIEDCGYSDVHDQFASVVKGRFPAILKWSSHRCQRKYGWGFKEASAEKQVEKCHLPMLFIHGGADTYVPTSMVNEVYEAKGSNRELWIPAGVGHGQAFGRANREYKRKVREFLEER